MTVRDIIMGSAGSSGTAYVDDVFSTSVYPGTGNLQNVLTTCNLSTGNSMIWIKRRNSNFNHMLTDTVQGVQYFTTSNNANPRQTISNVISSLNSTGFLVGADSTGEFNTSGGTYVSWVFKKASKFFDVVSYTGNGSNQVIPHSLGVTPGMILVKRLDSVGNWSVWHRNASTLYLDSSMAVGTNIFPAVTSSSFTVNSTSYLNGNGASFIAYVFAHDTDPSGLIQCGTFTSNSLGTATVSLGWEPQFFMFKSVNAGDWIMLDTMRGWNYASQGDSVIWANYADAQSFTSYGHPIGNGVRVTEVGGSEQFIYMAIRRRNKPPTTGTQVFMPTTRTGTASATTLTSAGFPPDLFISQERSAPQGSLGALWFDRLRGPLRNIYSSAIDTEQHTAYTVEGFDAMNGVRLGFDLSNWGVDALGTVYSQWNLRRAPGFFDIVRYVGGGPTTTVGISHNLGVLPELYIFKRLDTSGSSSGMDWTVVLPDGNLTFQLNSTAAATTGLTNTVLSISATSFMIGDYPAINSNGSNVVAYLFASLQGISKVGRYTGNGSSQTIDCGFTTGARFVLIKRRDSTGDWYVWDLARGIVSGNDPHLSLNTPAIEITTNDSIDPNSSGFIVNQVAATNINVNAATYIYLAIA